MNRQKIDLYANSRNFNSAKFPRSSLLCVPKTLNPTIVVMKSAEDGA
jgi:hypothetical protein